MHSWIVPVLALLLTHAAFGLKRSQPVCYRDCAKTCPTYNNIRYIPGNTYRFLYSVESTTYVDGARDKIVDASLMITSDAFIDVLSRCEMILRIRNTHMYSSNGRGKMKQVKRDDLALFQRSVRKSGLRFSFQDGAIDHVCFDSRSDDPPWVFNYKKGILSAFQTATGKWQQDTNRTETDVVGECPTHYTIKKRRPKSVTVSKVKDISACRRRRDSRRSFFAVPYGTNSDSTQLMNTTYSCQQELGNRGAMRKTDCTETHYFRPFSQEHGLIVTSIKQKLYQRQKWKNGKLARASKTCIKKRESLIFDHSNDDVIMKDTRAKVEEILISLCKNHRDVRPDTPQVFYDLVTKMKLLKLSDLDTVYRLLTKGDICSSNRIPREFFLDALSVLANSASLTVMTSLLRSGEVRGARATGWMTSMAFLSSPTLEMLEDVKPLLQLERTKKSALLPISALVNNFCAQVTKCSKIEVVLDIMTSIRSNLGLFCNVRKKTLEKTLLTLRALGNTGTVATSTSHIYKCLIRDSNPMSVRIAAVETFRRMPCKHLNRRNGQLWRTFMSIHELAELRIAAYLSMVRCADNEMLERIVTRFADGSKDGNDGDDVGNDAQVKAFVYSHLSNIRESSSPLKRELAKAIENLKLEGVISPKALNGASRNIELSVFDDEKNLGVTSESNILWADGAVLPHAFSANFTLDLFGRSINWLDFGGRTEGMETAVSKFFQNFQKGIPLKKWSMPSLKSTQGYVYLRVFGNEVAFVQLSDLKSQLRRNKKPKTKPISPWLNEILSYLPNQLVHSTTRGFQIIDVSASIPTLVGLSLRLCLNGTAAVDIHFNRDSLRKKGRAWASSLNFNGDLRPSAAVVLSGSLTMDAFVSKVGIRLSNTVRSSLTSNWRLAIDRKQGIDINVNAPPDKLEILQVSARMSTIHNSNEFNIKTSKGERNHLTACTGRAITAITGLELCSETQYPKTISRGLSSGPILFNVILHKTDTHSAYRMHLNYLQDKKSQAIHFVFDTPGSSLNRKILFEARINHWKSEAKINLDVPWRQSTFQVDLAKRRGLYVGTGTTTLRDTGDIFSTIVEVKVKKTRYKMEAWPKVTISIPERRPVKLTGSLMQAKGLFAFPRLMKADLTLTGMSRRPSSLSGQLTNKINEKSLQVSISPNGQKPYSFGISNFISNLPRKGHRISSSLVVSGPRRRWISLANDLNYKQSEGLKLLATVEIYAVLKKSFLAVDVSRSLKSKKTYYGADIKLKTSVLSGRFSCQVLAVSQKQMSVKTSLIYSLNKIGAVRRNHIKFIAKFQDGSKKTFKRRNFKSTFIVQSNPELNLDLGIDLIGRRLYQELDVLVKYGEDFRDKDKRLAFVALLKKVSTKRIKKTRSFRIILRAPQRIVDFAFSGRYTISPRSLQSNFLLEQQLRNSKRRITTSFTFKERSRKRMIKFDGDLRVSWQDKDCGLAVTVTYLPRKHFSFKAGVDDNAVTIYELSAMGKYKRYNDHDLEVQFLMPGMRSPLILKLSNKVIKRRLRISAIAMQNERAYGISIEGSHARDLLSGRISSNLNLLSGRKVLMQVAVATRPGRLTSKILVNLNANSKGCNRSCLIALRVTILKKKQKDNIKAGIDWRLELPFQELPKLGAIMKYSKDEAARGFNGKVYWGFGKGRRLAWVLNLKNPVRETIEADARIQTPLESMESIEFDLSHKWDPALLSVLEALLGRIIGAAPQAEVNNVWLNPENEDVKFNADVHVSLRQLQKTANVAIIHSGDANGMKSNWKITNDKDTYTYDMTVNDKRHGLSLLQSSGDLVVTTPLHAISTKWVSHEVPEGEQTSDSTWNETVVDFSLRSRHVCQTQDETCMSHSEKDFNVDAAGLPAQNINIIIQNRHQRGKVVNKLEVYRDFGSKANNPGDIVSVNGERELLTTSELDATWSKTKISAKYKLQSSQSTHPLTAAAQISFGGPIYIGNATVAWSPSHNITSHGSVVILPSNKFDINVSVVTPFNEFKNRSLRIISRPHSGKNCLNDMLGKITAKFAYGNQDDYDLYVECNHLDSGKAVTLNATTPLSWPKNVAFSTLYMADSEQVNTSVNIQVKGKLSRQKKIKQPLSLDGLQSLIQYPGDTKWNSDLDFTMGHTANGNSTTSHATVKYNKETFNVKSEYNHPKKDLFDYSMFLHTSVNGLEKIGGDFHFHRFPTTLLSSAEVVLGAAGGFNSHLEHFDDGLMNNFTWFWDMRSPAIGSAQYNLEFLKSPDVVEFKNRLMTPINDFGDMFAHASYSSDPCKFHNLKAELKTPLTFLKHGKMYLRHCREKKSLEVYGNMDYDVANLGTEFNFTYKDDVEASFIINSDAKKYSAVTSYKTSISLENVNMEPHLSPLSAQSCPDTHSSRSNIADALSGHHVTATVELGPDIFCNFTTDVYLSPGVSKFQANLESHLETLNGAKVKADLVGRKLSNFRASADFSAPITGDISVLARLRLDDLTQLSAESHLLSNKILPKHMNVLKLAFDLSQNATSTACDALIQWTKEKQINTSASVSRQDLGHQLLLTRAGIAVNSPFTNFRQGELAVQHTAHKDDLMFMTESITMKVFSIDVFDVNFELKRSGSGKIEFKLTCPCVLKSFNLSMVRKWRSGQQKVSSCSCSSAAKGLKMYVLFDQADKISLNASLALINHDHGQEMKTLTTRVVNEMNRVDDPHYGIEMSLSQTESNLDAVIYLAKSGEKIAAGFNLTRLASDGLPKHLAVYGEMHRWKEHALVLVDKDKRRIETRVFLLKGIQVTSFLDKDGQNTTFMSYPQLLLNHFLCQRHRNIECFVKDIDIIILLNSVTQELESFSPKIFHELY